MRLSLPKLPPVLGALIFGGQKMASTRSGGAGASKQRRGPPPARLFKLKGSSVLVISGGDLTRWQGDAIVNAANERMLGGGGVDAAVHRAAGPELLEACYDIKPVARNVRWACPRPADQWGHFLGKILLNAQQCPAGQARITPGFRLRAKHVIHTVGPIYEDHETSAPLLRGAFKSSFDLCRENGLKSVAFPAISCGVYGYPTKEAAEIAIQTTLESSEGIEHIEFVLFGQDTFDPFVAAASKQLEPLEPAQDDGAVPGKVEDIPSKARESEKPAKLPEDQEVTKGAESGHEAGEKSTKDNSTTGEEGGATDSICHADDASSQGKESSATSTGAGSKAREESHDSKDDNAAEPMSQDDSKDDNAAEPMSQDEDIAPDGNGDNKATAVNAPAAPTS